MRRLCLYIFFPVLFLCLGLFLGRYSSSRNDCAPIEVCVAKPCAMQQPVVVTKLVPLPMVSVTEHERIVYKEQDCPIDFSQFSTIVPEDDNQAPNKKSITSRSLALAHNAVNAAQEAHHHTMQRANVALQHAYQRQLGHAITVLQCINHKAQPVRLLARVQLAYLQVRGPLCQWIERLATSLLQRYCQEDGKLVDTGIDFAVQDDVNRTIALLQDEQERHMVPSECEQSGCSWFQHLVQQHKYNKALKIALRTNYILYSDDLLKSG